MNRSMSPLILGINSAHADSSAVLVGEDGILAAVAEERLNRRKHSAGFPRLAVPEVLRIAGASPADLTDIALADDPRTNLAAKIAFAARHPRGGVPGAVGGMRARRQAASAQTAVADALDVGAGVLRADVHQVEHHLAHIASSFYCSPFERAAGISADGAGDFTCAMVARCVGLDIWASRRTLWPHSPGVFYSALCQFLGFDDYGDEYKAMGLAGYGVNRFAPEMRDMIRWDPLRGLRLNLRYFRHHKVGLELQHLDDGRLQLPRLYSDAMTTQFGPARDRDDPITDRERDLAASMQARFEDMVVALFESATRLTGNRDAVVAGGCALNSVANGRLITERIVDGAYFHPAPADDGTAAGAALYVLHSKHRFPRARELRHAYLGAAFSDREIKRALEEAGLGVEPLDWEPLVERAAEALAEGRIVGWFQGREEWGPRALGNRSILCHPGWPGIRVDLNDRIKHREPFRPFAPAVLSEKLGVCFRGDHEVPFMNVVFRVRPEWKDRLSAVTHENGTGRVQTISREQNELFYDLIAAFEMRTNTPVLLNTSFNENEPIVHTPAQAIDCFLRTEMDALGIGPYWVEKRETLDQVAST